MDDQTDPERAVRGAPVHPGLSPGPGAGPAEPVVLSVSEAEFASFYRAEMARLVRFLLWQGARLADAADLAQEAMILAHRHWAQIHSNPGAWLRRAGSRAYLRRLNTVREEPAGEVLEPGLLLRSGVIEEWEQRHDLLVALAELPGRQRQVLAWTLDGFTPEEIATELKLTPEAVRASLYKGRRALAVRLQVTGEEHTR